MTTKQGEKSDVYLIAGEFSRGKSCFLARNHTYKQDKLLEAIRCSIYSIEQNKLLETIRCSICSIEQDKLLEAIGCSRYSIAWLLGEEELSPALTAAQMKRRAEYGSVPALLQYVQMLSDRTAPCGAVDATRWKGNMRRRC